MKFTEKFIATAQQTKKFTENDLLVNKDGIISIRNKKYGEFTTGNPPNPNVYGSNFSCNIYRNGEKDKFYMEMPTEEDVIKLENCFGAGTYIPEARLDLFNAMEDVSQKKQALMDKLKSLPD